MKFSIGLDSPVYVSLNESGMSALCEYYNFDVDKIISREIDTCGDMMHKLSLKELMLVFWKYIDKDFSVDKLPFKDFLISLSLKPSDFSVNLNDIIFVRLSHEGEKLFSAYLDDFYEETNLALGKRRLRVEDYLYMHGCYYKSDNQWLCFSWGDFLKIFGKILSNNHSQLFDDIQVLEPIHDYKD